MFKKLWGGRDEIHCPLCGSTASAPTGGYTRYTELRQNLLKVPEWLKAHASESGIKDIPAEVRQVVGDPRIPDLEAGTDAVHRRCTTCKSLLPPQFWRGGPASPLAMTVAGAVGHGKTTWLMSVLTPPPNSRYSIIGFNDHHTVKPYEFVEPYTIGMLNVEFRTPIPFLLMGCTIVYTDMMIDVRTLDIKGELFDTSLSEVSTRIENHLSARRGGGALLIVERFTNDEAEQRAGSIAKAYLDLSVGIREKLRRDDVLWKAVVWTHLDHARWNAEGEAWLRSVIDDPAPLLRLAGERPSYDTADVLAIYDGIRAHDDVLLRKLLRGVRDLDTLRGPAVEGIIALLFRLQLLYSAYVARKRPPLNRLEYFYSGAGQQYVRFCQELAKQLYILWDGPRGGLSPILTGADKEDDWQVIPCGRIMEPNQPPESVWNDQIVIQAIERVIRR